MAISSAQAIYGLNAAGLPSSTNVTGSVQIGPSQTQVQFLDADVAYSVRAIIAPGSAFVLDVSDGTTTGSDAWVAGVAQVETATAAGTIGSGGGNAAVTVTCDSMDNSPKTIAVAVTSGDTASVWAGKVRAALAADVDVSAVFSVSGTSTAIVLTVKEIGGLSIPIYPGNDATINVALDNGTCTGITPAPTSADTTAGVATSGCTIYDGDGKDFEGATIPTIAELKAILMQSNNGVCSYSTSSYGTLGTFKSGGIPLLSDSSILLDDVTFEPASVCDIKITVIGQTA